MVTGTSPALARRARRLARGERGGAVVEFALVAPLFLLLVFAAIDVGRAFYTVNQLATAVREGARLAAVQTNPGAAAPQIGAAMRQAAPGLGNAVLTDDMIEISTVADATNPRVVVRVRNYPLRFVTPFSKVLGKSQMTLTREATFRWEMAP